MSQLDLSLAIGISSLLSTQIQLARFSEQARLKTQAELKALQAQINPHFLFNSLNTLASFVRTDPVKARDLLLKLSDFFRSTLCNCHNLVPIKQELNSTLNYFSIEKARFEEKLDLIVEIPDEFLSVMILNFTIQPLVENAIKHGILPKNERGYVKLTAEADKDDLIFQVVDNGVGIPVDELEKILEEGYGYGSGIGLSNVASRIRCIFGPEYGIQIKSQINHGTQIFIKVPMKVSQEGGNSTDACISS